MGQSILTMKSGRLFLFTCLLWLVSDSAQGQTNFNILRSTVTGRAQWHTKGFTILLLVEGSCRIATPHEEVQLQQFERIVVPHGLKQLEITAPDRAVLLECLPPGTPGM
jgi:mannose-6-phosphate isomerase class I